MESLVAHGAPEDLRERDEWYHEIRKAAKRLRYAAESVEPAFGAPATTLAEAAEDLQEVLGEHQDSVVARAGAARARRPDPSGRRQRLHHRPAARAEQVRGDAAVADFAVAWEALTKKQIRRWLKR